ncbi:hypothetical protein CLOM_g6399 [Closterium sp. NIES-68]|nr:hypothetical protein CLOM_g6399 [Closterium sp. NIES-68]GJP68557.1 hypothetical protein CLOP_g25241 [Closterium sp. NIES-67]
MADILAAACDVSNNSFTGPFPSAILQSPYYYNLNLSANNFSGLLPPQVTSLTVITSLSLSHNQLQGSLPVAHLSSSLVSLQCILRASPGRGYLEHIRPPDAEHLWLGLSCPADGSKCVVQQSNATSFCRLCFSLCSSCTPLTWNLLHMGSICIR